MRVLVALLVCVGLLALVCDATTETRRHHHRRHHGHHRWAGLKVGWRPKHYFYISGFPCQLLPEVAVVRLGAASMEKPDPKSTNEKDVGVLNRMLVGKVDTLTLDVAGIKKEAADDVGRVVYVARSSKEVATRKGPIDFAGNNFVKEFPHRVCCAVLDRPNDARLVCQKTAQVGKIKEGDKIKLFANQILNSKDKLNISPASMELSAKECTLGAANGGNSSRLLTWPIVKGTTPDSFTIQKLNPDDKANGATRVQVAPGNGFKGLSGYYTPIAGDPNAESEEVCCAVNEKDLKLSCLSDEAVLSVVSGTPIKITKDAPPAVDADAAPSAGPETAPERAP